MSVATASASSSPSTSLDAQLIAATRDGKGFDECKALIVKGARVNAMNSNRNTALHYASRYGQEPLAKLLLEQGANPNVKNTNGWTPLHESAAAGQLSMAKLLLQHKADCNSKGMGGYTPLHDAAIKGHKALVFLLLDHGANTMAKNNENKTVHDVASRGITSMDLHLYKALQPTRSAIAKLVAANHENAQELIAIKDVMARQRKADFDTLRRETYQVQQNLQQMLSQQAAKHEQQMQAQRNEFLNMMMMMRNNGGGGGGGGGSISTEHENPAASSSSANEYNATAKSLPAEKSLEKSPSMTTVSTATSSTSTAAAAATTDTTALALQRLVLQRNNDMTTLRREITGTQESLAKMLREQVEEKVKATMMKMPDIASLRQEQERQAKVLENITSSSSLSSSSSSSANTSSNNNNNNAVVVDNGRSSNGSSDLLRQDVVALRDELAANKENVLTEMTNLKKEIKLVQKTLDNNAIQARSRALSSSSSEVGGGDHDAAAGDNNNNDTHLKQLQRKKSEKEEAAIAAMRDAFMSKHQADLETVRAEIVAAEEHLMGLIQQQKASPSSSSSPNNKSRSIPDNTANQDQDDTTFQGEEGDYVTHEELKKSLIKKTKKQEASLAELREEFTKLMEFLEHADVGSLRDDMMELVTSQVEQQNAAVAELREAITTSNHHRPRQQHKAATLGGLPPIHDDEDEEEDEDEDEEEEDDGSLEELKKTIEAQGEAQRKALTTLGDKLSLQRKQDMTALREETASTREHLENQIQQQSEQQETIIAALRDELSTGVVSPASKQQGNDTTLDGIRDEIKEMEESLKALIQNQSKKQDAALAALQKKVAMKEKEGKSAASDESSLKLIQKQQDEIKAQQQADIATLKKEIHATRASLKKISDHQQQKSNPTSPVQESRKVGSVGNNDNKAYEDLEAAITMLRKDISATNEKLNKLSAEQVPASPSQAGRPKWSARSLLSPMSAKPLINTARSAGEDVNEDEDKSVSASPVQKGRPKWSSPRSPRSTREGEHEQGPSASSDESLKLIQKQQEELKAQQQADIANLRKEISSTKESLKKAEGQRAELTSLQKDIEATKDWLKEITEQQQQHDMAALEEKFIAKENVKKIIQQSLSEQDSQREAQMESLLRTQEELDEIIKNLEELGGNASSKQKDTGDKEQEDQLRTDIADLRAMVSNYLLALKETMEEIAALREQVDVEAVGESEDDDASSKDSEMLQELDRMFDGQSEGSPNEEEVSLQEELRKVTAELKMVQAVADRYKDTVMKLHQISEQALS